MKNGFLRRRSLFVGILIALIFLSNPVRAGELDVKALVKANNAFAVNLYSQLKDVEGNQFFSP